MSISHLAGLPVSLDDRGIQRCACCGEVLIDTQGMMSPVGPGGKQPPPVAPWPENRWVRLSGSNPTRYEVVDDGWREGGEGLRPKDACFYSLGQGL